MRPACPCCGLWDRIGRKKIETCDLTLSAYLKERIVERWGVERLYSPKDDPKAAPQEPPRAALVVCR